MPAIRLLRMGRGILAFIVVLIVTGSLGWAVVSCLGVNLLH
jgi:hypothetical protein